MYKQVFVYGFNKISLCFSFKYILKAMELEIGQEITNLSTFFIELTIYTDLGLPELFAKLLLV